MKRIVSAISLIMALSAPLMAQEAPRGLLFAPMMPDGTSGQSLLQLVQRSEVTAHLSLTLNQQTAIKELAGQSQGIKISLTSNGPTPPDPEETKKEVERQVREQTSGVKTRLDAILKDEQSKRLHELALQWYGPLALANSKIAGEAKISPEHQQQIDKISREYQMKKMEVIRSVAETSQQGDPSSGRVGVAVRIDARKINKPGTPEFAKMTAVKKEAEEKILDLLSDSEKAKWTEIQGKPFTFRNDVPGNRF